MGASFLISTATAARYNPAVQGMQTRLSEYQWRDNIPMVGLHGVVSRPLPGVQLAVMMQDSDPNKAVCIGVHDPRFYLAGLPDGTVGLAHHLGATVLFYGDRIEVQGATMPIQLLNCVRPHQRRPRSDRRGYRDGRRCCGPPQHTHPFRSAGRHVGPAQRLISR